MDAAKIRLSPTEMELVSEASWILTKNEILEKSMVLLGEVQKGYAACLDRMTNKLSAEILHAAPKISTGERYEGLPYRVLDYPRYFEQENIFVIRTLFWWGNFFSITLQLSGRYQQLYAGRLADSWSQLRDEFNVCINEDPWQHHFAKDNYRPIQEVSEGEFGRWIKEKPFIKLAARTELLHWDNIPEILPRQFEKLIRILLD